MTHDFKSQQGTDAFATLALTYACRF
jgi:hypothetical protein